MVVMWQGRLCGSPGVKGFHSCPVRGLSVRAGLLNSPHPGMGANRKLMGHLEIQTLSLQQVFSQTRHSNLCCLLIVRLELTQLPTTHVLASGL